MDLKSYSSAVVQTFVIACDSRKKQNFLCICCEFLPIFAALFVCVSCAKKLFEAADIRYTDFIRTSETRHKLAVHHLWVGNHLIDTVVCSRCSCIAFLVPSVHWCCCSRTSCQQTSVGRVVWAYVFQNWVKFQFLGPTRHSSTSGGEIWSTLINSCMRHFTPPISTTCCPCMAKKVKISPRVIEILACAVILAFAHVTLKLAVSRSRPSVPYGANWLLREFNEINLSPWQTVVSQEEC